MLVENLVGRDITVVKGDNIKYQIYTTPKPISQRHQLLPEPPIFTGRETELNEILKEFNERTQDGATVSLQYVGIQGMGGVGKTALATVLAHRLRALYPDAQLFLDLRGADPRQRERVTPEDAMKKIIQVFHPEHSEAQLPETIDELAPIYRSVLSDAGRVILLLDNVADTEQLKPLMPPCNCFLLVTSRNKFELPGLTARIINSLRLEEARDLLLRLAPRLAELGNEAAELCGCLPLALEVFAGLVNANSLTPVNELVTRLRERRLSLDGVNAAFAISYELLADSQRIKWTQLAIFSGDFELHAATAVWELDEGDARDVMQTMVNACLVECRKEKAVNLDWNARKQDDDGIKNLDSFLCERNLFRLHDLVRVFCNDKLTDVEREASLSRCANHFLSLAIQCGELYKKFRTDIKQAQKWLALFNRERAHIESAFNWLRARQDTLSATMLISMVEAITNIGWLLFRRNTQIYWLETQLGAARSIIDRGAEWNALAQLAHAYSLLGNPYKIIEYHTQALEIAKELQDRGKTVFNLKCLGSAYMQLADFSNSAKYLQEAMVEAHDAGDRINEALIIGQLGIWHLRPHEEQKAIEFFERALEIFREFNYYREEAETLSFIGLTNARLGKSEKAIAFCKASLAIIENKRFFDMDKEGFITWRCANTFAMTGKQKEAIEEAEIALSLFECLNNGSIKQQGFDDPFASKMVKEIHTILAKWRNEEWK